MHINYADDGRIESIDAEKTGNRRKMLEKVFQRWFTGHDEETKMYRAALIAAGEAESNPHHPHCSEYERLADEMTVKTTEVDDGETIRITIREESA